MSIPDKLFEEFFNSCNKTTRSATASFVVVMEDEDGDLSFKKRLGRACHADLNVHHYDGETPISVFNHVQRNFVGYVGDKLAIEFLDYLANRSMYKSAFVTKDAKFMVDYGMVLSTDVPHNLLAGAAIVTRILWEHTEVVQYWKTLVDTYKIQEDVALLAAHAIQKITNGYSFDNYDGGHRAIYGGNLYKDSIKRALSHDFFPSKDTYKKAKDYGNVHYFISGPRKKEGERLFHNFKYKRTLKKKLWGREKEVYYDENLNNLAQFLKKKTEEAEEELEKGAKKEQGNFNDYRVIQDICVANGFSLAEVRRIRGELRQILSEEVHVDFMNKHIYELPKKDASLCQLFNWDSSPQGHEYWDEIRHRLRRAGLGGLM